MDTGYDKLKAEYLLLETIEQQWQWTLDHKDLAKTLLRMEREYKSDQEFKDFRKGLTPGQVVKHGGGWWFIVSKQNNADYSCSVKSLGANLNKFSRLKAFWYQLKYNVQ